MAKSKHLKNAAQAKYGHDIGRSIYYRQDFHQPWPEIAKTIPRPQRLALAKRHNYPLSYLRLKAAERHGQTLSQHPA